MDSFDLKKRLQQIVKKINIELAHGKINDEYLVDLEFYKEKKWDMINFDEYEINPIIIDLFVQSLREYNIESIETFLIDSDYHITYFKTLEAKYNKIVDVFYNTIAEDKDWRNIDVIASPIIICDYELNFIIIIDEYRVEHYFFGGKVFKNKIFPASPEAKKDFLSGYCDRYEDTPLRIDYINWLYQNYLEGSVDC